MLRIFHDTHYDFIRWWRWAAALTVAFILLGAASFAVTGGVNYSIEFTSGTLMQLEFRQPPDVGAIRGALTDAGIQGTEIQQFGSPREFTVRAQDRREAAEQASGAHSVSTRIEGVLRERFGADAFRVVRTEAVGPRVGAELRRGAMIAILLSSLVTLVYLAVRFEWRFGLAAVLGTAHDVLVTLTFIKLMHLEVSLTVVAAILTLLGYSLNDTIIIFDRVREDLRKSRKESLRDTLNRAINETLPRSILTHVTTFTATLALLLFAGEVIRPFAWVMALGVIVATFSSIYVAGPLLLWIERRWPRAVDDRRGLGADAARASARTRPSPPADAPPPRRDGAPKAGRAH